MIYCDNMEKRSIGNFLGVLVEIQLYMDNYAKEVMEVTKRNGGWRIKEMKRSYKKNGKKKKVKSVEKISKCYICCYGNSMYVFLCPCCLLIISCVASVLSSFTLSWVVTIHCTSLVLPHSFSAAVFSVFCCLMFDRVLLFEIACSSWGSPYQHQHLHKVY